MCSFYMSLFIFFYSSCFLIFSFFCFKYLPLLSAEEGAHSSASCISCSVGKYGGVEGLAECSSCPTGQVQPSEGQDSCKECTLEGKIKTNNEEHTTCIDNKALLSTSMVVVTFHTGGALSLAFPRAGVLTARGVVVRAARVVLSTLVNPRAPVHVLHFLSHLAGPGTHGAAPGGLPLGAPGGLPLGAPNGVYPNKCRS